MRPTGAERVVTWGLSLLLGAGILWALGQSVVGALLDSWAASGRDVTLVHLALVVAASAGWLHVVVMLGPMARTASSVAWRREAPALRPFVARYAMACLGAAVVVSVTLVGMPLGPTGTSALVTSVAAAALLVLSLVAAVGQLADARGCLVGCVHLLGLVAVALLALSVGDRVVAAALAIAAVASAVRAGRTCRPRRPGPTAPRWLLVRAAEQRWAWTASMVLLDGSVARQAKDRWSGHATTRPWVVHGLGRDVARQLLLLRRQLPALGVVYAPVGYAVHLVADWSTSSAMSVVAVAMAAFAPSASRISDRWDDAPALRRTYAGTPPWVLAVAATTALLLLAVVGCAVAQPPLTQGLLVLALAPALVMRRRRARRAEPGALAATPLGPVSVAAADRAIAGWDLAALTVVVLALA